MDGREGRLASLAYEAALAEDIGELREIVTRGLRTIVDADLASYTEVSLKNGASLALVDEGVVVPANSALRLAELAQQHPLIVRHASHAEAISDHLTDARFRALELYQDVYRDLGARDQLAVTIHNDEEMVVGLAFNRSRRGFSAEDRRALDALAAVVRRARDRVAVRARGRELLSRLEGDPSHWPAGVVALSPSGAVEFVSDRARAWLHVYFPGHRGTGLPQELLDRLLTDPSEEARTDGPDGTLTVRRLPPLSGDHWLLELHEDRHSARFALTVREREILDRVALGESNAAIARALRISTRTVENHLRAIYRKLGVSSRTAALARVRG